MYNQDKQAVAGDNAYLSATSIPNRFGLKGQGGSSLGKELTFNLTESDLLELRKSLGLSGTSAQSQFSVLQLRMAEVLQRYREVLQTGDQTFKSRMEQIWNVSVPAYMSDLSYRVGGYELLILTLQMIIVPIWKVKVLVAIVVKCTLMLLNMVTFQVF